MPVTSTNGPSGRERAAVIGAGVAGLTAAYLLQRRFDVTLYERDDRLGGHAHTHDVATPDAGAIPVDSGFIVFNERTYPRLLRLFGELGVPSQPAEMSMSIRCEGCGLVYAGARGARGVFAERRSGTNPRFLRMLVEIKRFHRLAMSALRAGDTEMTLRQFLRAHRFSPYFERHFMVPMVSCVWSMSAGDALGYPAGYLFTFLHNHGMLTVKGSPEWRTVVGGSRTYVERIAKSLTNVATSTPVRTIERDTGGVVVRDAFDQDTRFSRVVVATHADTALRLLARPTPRERSVLGAFSYSRNETWLHSDARVLPRVARARSSWNYLLPSCEAEHGGVLVTYDMNRLQSLPTSKPQLVTLNATDRIDPREVVARMTYEHPIYTPAAVAAQAHLDGLNREGVAFAGAYHGWGFHEDGCRAGIEAAASLGVGW